MAEKPIRPEAPQPVRVKLLGLASLGLVAVGTILSVFDIGGLVHIDVLFVDQDVRFGIFWVLGGVAGVIIYINQQREVILLQPRFDIDRIEEEDIVGDVLVAQWRAGLGDEQRDYLLDLICRPTEHIRRITDTVRFATRSFEIETSLVIDEVEVEAAYSYLLPVHWQPKGRPIDGLSVTAEGTQRVSTLASADANALLIALADRLADDLAGRYEMSPENLDLMKSTARELLKSRPVQGVDDHRRIVESSDGSVGKLLNVDDDDAARFKVLTSRFTGKFPVIVVVPALKVESTLTRVIPSPVRRTRRITVKRTEQDVAVYPKSEIGRTEQIWRGLERLALRVLAVDPPRINVPIDNADRARSYHLFVHAMPGDFFHTMEIIYLDGKRLGLATEVEGSEPKLQSFGHLHLRGAQKMAGYLALTTFRERIPGSISEAVLGSGLVALLTLSVILAKGAVFQGVFAALVPVVFATILTGTIWRTVNQLGQTYGGRISSRIISLGTIGLAVIAIVRSSMDAGLHPGTATADPITWKWLFVGAFVLSIFGAATWFVDIAAERRMARPPKGEEPRGVELEKASEART